MSDDLVTKVKMALESDSTPRVFHIRSVDALALVSCIKSLTSERDRLREALAMIDAIDPEHHIDGCAQTVVRGLVLRMGETARAALKGETP